MSAKIYITTIKTALSTKLLSLKMGDCLIINKFLQIQDTELKELVGSFKLAVQIHYQLMILKGYLL